MTYPLLTILFETKYPAENLNIQIGQKESIAISSLRFENLLGGIQQLRGPIFTQF